jgi:hypothetical protein
VSSAGSGGQGAGVTARELVAADLPGWCELLARSAQGGPLRET